jgi:hypothetical protein
MSNEYESTIRDMQKSIDEYQKQVNSWMKATEKHSIDATMLKIERDKYLSILMDIKNAIDVVGPVPQYHYHVMRKHRSEWPTLWKAIDKAVQDISNEKNK